MKKGDLYIILATLFLLLSVLVFYQLTSFPDGERYVEIRIKNEVITTVKLTDRTNMKILLLTKDDKYLDYKILKPDEILPEDITGYDLIYIHNKGVEVLDADCPQRIIVKQGFRKVANMPLICIPRSLSITIKSLSETYEVDAFV